MKNLVIYMTMHYPDREEFFRILELLDMESVGCVELGIPVTDPYKDGEVIRQTHSRVLKKGLTHDEIRETLEEIRHRFGFRVVLMTYGEGAEYFRLYDIPEHLYDGFICVDKVYSPDVFKNQIRILSHDMNQEELSRALEFNSLFAYVVSGDGKTGTFTCLPTQYIGMIERIKKISEIPAYVGFGVKSAADVRAVLANGADGAIIGTEFIRRYQAGGLSGLSLYLGELSNIEL